MNEKLKCPMCGKLLSIYTTFANPTDELIIGFFCDGTHSDEFSFSIHTGLTQLNIDNLTDLDEVIEMKMDVYLELRQPRAR